MLSVGEYVEQPKLFYFAKGRVNRYSQFQKILCNYKVEYIPISWISNAYDLDMCLRTKSFKIFDYKLQ